MEIATGREFHTKCLRLNSGRNALEFILRSHNYRKIYLPYYTCDVLLTPLQRTGVEYDYYSLNRYLQPVFDFSSLKADQAIVVNNCFGLLDPYISTLPGNKANIIVDNAQAFYAKPVEGMDCFYSPRKFFGVPDGAYLYPKNGDMPSSLYGELGQDESWDRCLHLLKRLDGKVEEGYMDFKKLSPIFQALPLRKMSTLTVRLLDSIDYNRIKASRRENFGKVHSALGKYNNLQIDLGTECVPLVYPFYAAKRGLRKRLIEKSVFVPQYWGNVKNWAPEGSLERDLADKLVAVPIDQRYRSAEIDAILDVMLRSINS